MPFGIGDNQEDDSDEGNTDDDADGVGGDDGDGGDEEMGEDPKLCLSSRQS